jgi:formylmethanofuran dehydrogenase subunit A
MIVIRDAEVFDYAHGINGTIRDVWVDGQYIAAPPEEPSGYEEIDGKGCILAPAGVEIHSHIAGYGLDSIRQFLSNNFADLDSLAPSPDTIAERYLKLGYTTIFDAASSPLLSLTTHRDLDRMRGVDRGTYTLMGDHALLLEALASGNAAEIRDTIAWLLKLSGGYAVKLVNPGSGFAWKNNIASPGLDDSIGWNDLTQRKIIQRVVAAVNEMGLPHPVHLHARKLGQPGNQLDFVETIHALDGQRAHLCHIQFYAYGSDDKGGYTSAAERVVKCISAYKNLTFDIGQIVPGLAMAITADTSSLDSLRQMTHHPWISHQLEGEGGVNTLPLEYLPADPTSAIQWATGMELLLRFPDPTRMFLTTDHPNGGPFTAYPQVINWLMDRSARDEMVHSLHPAGASKSGLSACQREYTLEEVFAMTSYGPAKSLGLTERGHLGVGALADLRCYKKQSDLKAMFENPAWVMRQGRVVVKNGKVRKDSAGRTLLVRPSWDEGRRKSLLSSLSKKISFQPVHYGLGEDHIFMNELEVPCSSKVS